MKFKFLLWIIVMSILVLITPLVSANRHSHILGNETFTTSDVNWSTAGSTGRNAGTLELDVTADGEAIYVHALPNISITGKNYSITWDMAINTNSNGHVCLGLSEENDTQVGGGGGGEGIIIAGGGTNVLVKYVDGDGDITNLEDVKSDGTWHRWEIQSFSDQIRIYINGTLDIDSHAGNNEGNMSTLFFGLTENNCALNVDNVTIYNSTNKEGEAAAPPTAIPTFTITAQNRYDSASLSDISIRIFNSSFELNFSTSNGTMPILNSTTGSGNRPIIFEKFYDITFGSNETGGYFNYTNTTINITDVGSLTGSLFQSLLNLYVNDSLTDGPLSSFTITTNYSSFGGTNGYILLYTKAGANHVFNVTSTQYPKGEFSYSINALENNSMTVNISPIFNFYLRREADNSLFDIASTNTTKLTIFCPEKNIIINFRNETYNSTEENITMDCPYTLMKMDISYGSSSYFRSLIPETSQQNVTWWLLDLDIDTGVQKILELIDLTGEWSSGLLRTKTAIGANNEDIIEQEFDISTAVILYLLKDALYTISIENNARTEERQLGSLIADSAGTVTITFPNIEFYPEETYLEDNITYSYFDNATSNILRFTYLDKTQETTLITWEIYNESSNLLQTFTSTSSDVILTYNSFLENRTYFTNLEVQHALLDFNITEARVFGNPASIVPDLPGWTEEEATDLKLFIAIIFLVVWGFLFTSKHAALGLTTTFIWLLVFRWSGWIDIGYLLLSVMGIIAISTWIVEVMKKE